MIAKVESYSWKICFFVLFFYCRKLERTDRSFYYELPVVIDRKKYGSADVVQRVRLQYDNWRDSATYPKFTRRLYDQHITKGHTLRMEVNVIGDPEAEVKWYKDGLPIIQTSNIKVSTNT